MYWSQFDTGQNVNSIDGQGCKSHRQAYARNGLSCVELELHAEVTTSFGFS